MIDRKEKTAPFFGGAVNVSMGYNFAFRPDAPKPDIPSAGMMFWKMAHFEDSQIVAIDTETTGVAYGSEVIEIGAAKIDVATGEVVESLDIFVKPDSFGRGPSRLLAKITELTGITNQMLDENGISMYEATKMLDAFIDDCPIVFHNAAFDWTRYIYPAFDQVRATLHKGYDVYDTMLLAKTLPIKSRKLDALCERYGISFEGHHRANVDAANTGKVLCGIKNELFEKEEAEEQCQQRLF